MNSGEVLGRTLTDNWSSNGLKTSQNRREQHEDLQTLILRGLKLLFYDIIKQKKMNLLKKKSPQNNEDFTVYFLFKMIHCVINIIS